MKSAWQFAMIAAAFVAGGCCNTLVHTRVKPSDPPRGIRWTESRTYDVYVYMGGEPSGMQNEAGDWVKTKAAPELIYAGVHDLTDRVSGEVIDKDRPTWDVNYRAMPFADGGLALQFGENGMPKLIKSSGESGAAGALNAAATVAKTAGELTDKK